MQANRERVFAVVLPLLLGAAFIAVWQVSVRMLAISPVLLPAPEDVFALFGKGSGELASNAWQTGSEALVAFMLSAFVGVAVALLLTSSTLAFEAFYPHLVTLQIIPKIALAPLFVAWFGYETISRLAFAVFVAFFPVALMTVIGLDRTDANALRLSHALGASRWQTLTQVRIPYALPYFFSGLKIAATMSVVGVIVAEFISSRNGLGHYILYSQSHSETAHIFAALVVLCVVGLIPYAVALTGEWLARAWWRG